MDTIEADEEVRGFQGVYLLTSKSEQPHHNGRCYIGYTKDPNRRIKQHNLGRTGGGARKTENRGPWKMILIVHGFPNNISALRFEWAWQQPKISRRLKFKKELHRRKRNETFVGYNIRVLSEMLQVGPWNCLPLTVRWICADIMKTELMLSPRPPLHMNIVSGRIKVKKEKKSDENSGGSLTQTYSPCHICNKRIPIGGRVLGCLQKDCPLLVHIQCLAHEILTPGHYLPIEGDCPLCGQHFLWGDLIRQRNEHSDYENDSENSSDVIFLNVTDNEDNSDDDEV